MAPDQSSLSDSAPSWLEAAFLSAYHAETEPKSLDYYQGLFPGFEDQVRELHEHILDEVDAPRSQEGAMLGRYRLQSELGRGGQGVVYLAEDPELERQVAVKILRDMDVFGSGLSSLRWSREQRLAARIDHPGVCPILEFGQEGSSYYSVYPYVRGHSLRKLIQTASKLRAEPDVNRGARELADKIGLLARATEDPAARREALDRALDFHRKLALAVQAIHEQEIVHRDLKPANILVRENGDPVILDLGLARDDSKESLILTQEGDRLGTPAYMAPEQLLSDHEAVATAADLWALGIVLSECLMLRRPFEGPTREALYRSILDSKPQALSLGMSSMTSQLSILQQTLLAKEPGRRYQRATDLAEDLRRIRAREPILARPPSNLERARLWARRKPLLAASLLGLVGSLAAVAITLALLLMERGKSTREQLAKQGAMRQMTNEMLLDVQIELGKLPGTLALRKRMFEKAMAWLSILEKEKSRDAGLYRDLLEAHLGFGDVLGYPSNPNMGEPDQALKQYERALVLTNELEEDPPPGIATSEIHRFRARAHRKIASTLYSLRQADEVGAHFDAALRASRLVLAADPDGLEDRERQVAILGQMASTYNEMDRKVEALALSQEATGMSRKLITENPDDADILANHAATLMVQAFLQESSGQPGRALETLRSYRDQLTQALSRYPAHTALAHYVLVYSFQAARLLMATGRKKEAFVEFERTLSLQEQRARSDPDNEMVARLGLRYGMQYASALLQSGQQEKGIMIAEKALAEGRSQVERWPRSVSLRSIVSSICGFLRGVYTRAEREADVQRMNAIQLGLAGKAAKD